MKLVHSAATLSQLHSKSWMMTDLLLPVALAVTLEEGMFIALLVASRVKGKVLSTTSFMFLKSRTTRRQLGLEEVSGISIENKS